VRRSAWALALLTVYCWLAGGFRLDLDERRMSNLRRFLGELVPYPLRDRFELHAAGDWVVDLVSERGLEAAVATLAIAVAAICLAGLAGAMLSLPAARNITAPEAFLEDARPPSRAVRAAWAGVVFVTRVLLIFLRSIPEYVWAFLLISMIGPSAWPAVLALAIHNAGILGKLGGEVVENLDDRSLSALRGLGATRRQIVVAAIYPAALSRFLLFFFYRWETCVREATVLGMLGIVSLGYWIQDARARNHYDTMIFLVGIAVLIVLIGDIVSVVARRVVRDA
jgi:phosphonate transport system permease protein